jgi:hypothetical protein
MKAFEIAAKASELTGGDRAAAHGDKLENHSKIAILWNAILACKHPAIVPLNAMDVANMMEALKIARRYAGDHNIDDYIDGAGYAAVAGEIAEKMEANRKEWADANQS